MKKFSNNVAKIISNYLNKNKILELFKYNKNLQKKFGIKKFDYQILFIKKNFRKIDEYDPNKLQNYLQLNYGLFKEKEDLENLKNISLILKNELSQKKLKIKKYKNSFSLTMNSLRKISSNNNNFYPNKLIIKNIKGKLILPKNINLDNIKHLVISISDDISIPVSVLINLEILVIKMFGEKLQNYNIKFYNDINDKKEIFLNKLKKLQIINFKENSSYIKHYHEDLKFNLNNLEKLKIFTVCCELNGLENYFNFGLLFRSSFEDVNINSSNDLTSFRSDSFEDIKKVYKYFCEVIYKNLKIMEYTLYDLFFQLKLQYFRANILNDENYISYNYCDSTYSSNYLENKTIGKICLTKFEECRKKELYFKKFIYIIPIDDLEELKFLYNFKGQNNRLIEFNRLIENNDFSTLFRNLEDEETKVDLFKNSNKNQKFDNTLLLTQKNYKIKELHIGHEDYSIKDISNLIKSINNFIVLRKFICYASTDSKSILILLEKLSELKLLSEFHICCLKEKQNQNKTKFFEETDINYIKKLFQEIEIKYDSNNYLEKYEFIFKYNK